MSSILPGFEYDIFVSYRHNDNRSGWVTEFVRHLQEELAATIKEPVSVYFDSNPHDGLLETHDVDDSLKEKLNCFIFIPIVSQTYCDVKSFAWKHEFQTFRKNAAGDRLGIKIKLANGNVSGRILPVCIHELDQDDKQLFENELGSVLRGIEFIYRAPGVVRPLNPSEEDPKGNLNHTYYRDQLNKVARTVKDLISAVQQIGSGQTFSLPRKEANVPKPFAKKVATIAMIIVALGVISFATYYFLGVGQRVASISDTTIAILPFENLSKDSEQDYFSNGMMEDILNQLNKISELKVKSVSSVLQYERSTKSINEIGKELGVGSVLQGSVRRVGNTVRIVVKLIDTETDNHVWSETYDRELKDVLAVQSEIAIKIAGALRARLSTNEKDNIENATSPDFSAYDYFLRARDVFYKSIKKEDYEKVLVLLNRSLAVDSGFSRAYALKGRVWFNLANFGVSEKIWCDSVLYLTAKAIELDPSLPDGFAVRGAANRLVGRIKESNEDIEQAYHRAPGDPYTLFQHANNLLSINKNDAKGADLLLTAINNQYSKNEPEYYVGIGRVYLNAGNFPASETLIKKAISINPESAYAHHWLSRLYRLTKNYEKGIAELKQAEKINPTNSAIIDELGWMYYLNNDFDNAKAYWSRYPEIENTFEDSSQTVPYRHRLGMTYLKMGKKREAESLFSEALKIQSELLRRQRSLGSWGNVGANYYDHACLSSYFGDTAKAVQYLDSAIYYDFSDPWGFYFDPMLDNLRKRNDFKKLLQKVIEHDEFRKRSFSNALNRMQSSDELKNLLK